MPYKFCCFVSYPHGQGDVIKHKVEDFIQGLERELIPLIDKPEVYYDKGLIPGHKINSVLGQNLCKSVCMIFVYMPIYFNKVKLNCARELKAMEDLERKRLEIINDEANGLIIPVIFRGLNKFPKRLQGMFYKDFTDISFANTRSSKISHKYSSDIKEIAQYIADRCEKFDKVDENIWKECDNFSLPDDDEVIEYVEMVFGEDTQDPFPIG